MSITNSGERLSIQSEQYRSVQAGIRPHWAGVYVFGCNLTCHQNDPDLLRATAVTRESEKKEKKKRLPGAAPVTRDLPTPSPALFLTADSYH